VQPVSERYDPPETRACILVIERHVDFWILFLLFVTNAKDNGSFDMSCVLAPLETSDS
jgi:hypothetical protein